MTLDKKRIKGTGYFKCKRLSLHVSFKNQNDQN